MKIKKVAAFFLLCLIPAMPSWGYWIWSPEQGKFINAESAGEDTADAQYQYALQLYREKNLEKAEKELSDLVDKFPAASIAPEAQYRLGTIYEEIGDYLKAFKAYKKLIDSYPQSERLTEIIEREYRIGNVFLSGKKGKFMGLEILPSLPKAAEVFMHIVEKAPYGEYGDKAQQRLGIVYKQMGQYEKAMEAFQGLIDQYPQSELVPEARFELAETSFLKSANEFRDQRALDEAGTQVEEFLERYPDSESSVTAAKFRQQIDEKNAEKNYRIGLYYEKTDYLQSALIYYKDVAERYPHTKWGEKANERLQALKQPAEFLGKEAQELADEIQRLRQQLAAIPEKDNLEAEQLKRKIERLEKRQESVEKSKKESLESHEADIKRRTAELKQKFKNLEKKEKLLQKTPSDDLQKAMDRWRASLIEEQAALENERQKLAGWREDLGVEDRRWMEMLPFIGDGKQDLEGIRSLDAKDFYKLSAEKTNLLEEKELLYKQRSEILHALGEAEDQRPIAPENEAAQQNLQNLQQEIQALETQIEEKRQAYETQYGEGWKKWMQMPGKLVQNSAAAITGLNPFHHDGSSLESMSLEALLEQQMHLKEKVAAQQGMVETLQDAFNEELALKEQKRIMQMLESDTPVDPQELRKTIRQTEKEIRGRYEEIKDRHKRKKDLLNRLDELFKTEEDSQGILLSTADTVTAPVRGFGRFWKAFFFGLPDKDVELTKSVKKMKDGSAGLKEQAMAIRTEIEKESLIIEARSEEIKKMKKELDILKAKASLQGGLQFRSAMVDLPFSFIREAVESANRLIPEQDRAAKLTELLADESQKLERLKKQQQDLEAALQSKTPAPASEAPTVETAQEETGLPAEVALKEEIERLIEQLKTRQKAFDEQQQALRSLPSGETVAATTEAGKKLQKELQEVESRLQKAAKEEQKLEAREAEILGRRLAKADEMIGKAASEAMREDLKTEKQRLEERLSQVRLRQDFLSNEMKRFQAGSA